MQKYLRTDVSVPRQRRRPALSPPTQVPKAVNDAAATEPRRCRDGELAATCATARARAYPSAVHCTLKPFFALP